jgi:hypothetical protein
MAKIAQKVKAGFTLTFQFEDAKGTTRVFDLSKLSEAMIRELAVHGASQKLGDSYSGVKVVTEAIQSVDDVWDNLMKGNFNATVSGSGILAEAVARIKGITIEEATAAIRSLDEEAVEKLKKNDRVKGMMIIIRGERAQMKIAETDEDIDIGV